VEGSFYLLSPHPTPHTRSDLGVSFCRTQKLTAEAHTPHPTPTNKLFAANPT